MGDQGWSKTAKGFGWYLPDLDKATSDKILRTIMNSDGVIFHRSDFHIKCIDPRYTIPLDREMIINELLQDINTPKKEHTNGQH